MTALSEALEAARRIVEAAERRSANMAPNSSLRKFSEACGDLYSSTKTEQCIALARAVISLSASRADDGWLPIEEAPKDGTPVELLTISVCEWRESEPVLGEGSGWRRTDFQDRVLGFRALPSPPKE